MPLDLAVLQQLTAGAAWPACSICICSCTSCNLHSGGTPHTTLHSGLLVTNIARLTHASPDTTSGDCLQLLIGFSKDVSRLRARYMSTLPRGGTSHSVLVTDIPCVDGLGVEEPKDAADKHSAKRGDGFKVRQGGWGVAVTHRANTAG